MALNWNMKKTTSYVGSCAVCSESISSGFYYRNGSSYRHSACHAAAEAAPVAAPVAATAALAPAAVRTLRERESFRDEEFTRLAAAARSAREGSGDAYRAASAAVAAHPYSVACRAWYRRNNEDEE